MEHENISLSSFLDGQVCRKNGKFVTSVYRKPIFSGVFTNSESFISLIRFFNNLYTPTVIVRNVPKRNIYIKLLFLGSTSFQIRKKFQKLFNDKLRLVI